MSDFQHNIADLPLETRVLLEQRLLQKLAGARGTSTIPRRDTVGAPCPLSFAQQRLWILDQLEPNRAVYNVPRAVRLRGVLNIDALRGTLDAIVGRHEVLRTTFASADGSPVQVLAERWAVDLRVVDLSEWPPDGREAELRHQVTVEAERPFDFGRDLMLRATLFRLADAEHVLLLVLHHIASDGWSMGVLFREMSALYAALARGRSVTLPPLAIQYADYAVWQRGWLTGTTLEAQLTYWRERLAGIPAFLALPTDRPRPAIQTFRGATRTVTFPRPLADALRALSRRESATLFMTLLAAFQALLHRYAGEDDIVVGTPMAGRTRTETEGLIGFFVNTLVLRTDLSGNPTARTLLRRTREAALGAFAHPDLPFERLVEDLKPARSLSHTPLFQVMFSLHNTPTSALRLPGIEVSPFRVERETAKFDLTLSMQETAQGLKSTIEYSTDLFDAATVTRLLGHFQSLLEGVTADPEQPVSALPLLTEPERHQLLVTWNDTGAASPRVSLPELIEAQVDRTPDAIAVEFDGAALTYRELDRRANRLARRLLELGVGPETLVGLCLERSLDTLVSPLAVLKAGGTYVPLDPSHPPERLAFILADAGVPVLVTQERLRPRLPSSEARVLCVDAARDDGPESETRVVTHVAPDALAYTIYTSGSTGRPKGVQVTHESVVNVLDAMRRRPGFTAQDVFLAVTTLSFDIAGLELFLPLSVGGRVVIVSQAVAADGARLIEWLERAQATVLQATPATWRLLLAAGWRGSPRLTALCGGESLPRDLADALLARCASLWNMYGPTETTIWSTMHRVEAGPGPVPIGRPIANTQLYLLDAHRGPVPVGIPGELYIGGDGLARGYLNRPELTAERFVPHPFGTEPGARLYRTGDLGRYRPDGALEFLGRNDDQVKIRGFRVELGEIEAVLREHPQVREAVLVAREDTLGDPRLIAYVVPAQAPPPSTGELQEFVKRKLPGYMVPTTFVGLEGLPLNPNGKVDRRALSLADQTPSQPDKAFVAPRDGLELQLSKIWERVLGVRPVGIRDSFFDLGGHSLLAVRLFAEIEKLSGKHLPLATLFQAPTVERLAHALRQEGWSTSWSSLVTIQPGGSRPPLFCIHAHGGHALCYQNLVRHLDPDQPVYGLEARGLDGREPPRTRIEDMAAHYLQEIRALQAEGPYFLGGYCLGGTVAFEIAHQLHAQGQAVALLALFETTRRGRTTTRLQRFARRLGFEADNLRRLGAGEQLAYLVEKTKKVAMKIRYRVVGTVGIESARNRAIRKVEAAHVEALRAYVPRVYPGRMVLFRATTRDPYLGWGELVAGGIETVEVSPNGQTIVEEPRVRLLAARLRDWLEPRQGTGAKP